MLIGGNCYSCLFLHEKTSSKGFKSLSVNLIIWRVAMEGQLRRGNYGGRLWRVTMEGDYGRQLWKVTMEGNYGGVTMEGQL